MALLILRAITKHMVTVESPPSLFVQIVNKMDVQRSATATPAARHSESGGGVASRLDRPVLSEASATRRES
jgi:hypothetical protein